MITPEELRDQVMINSNIPERMGQAVLDIIRAAFIAAYLDAADYCDETASEHTTNLYGKAELEMVAELLRLRATGEEIR